LKIQVRIETVTPNVKALPDPPKMMRLLALCFHVPIFLLDTTHLLVVVKCDARRTLIHHTICGAIISHSADTSNRQSFSSIPHINFKIIYQCHEIFNPTMTPRPAVVSGIGTVLVQQEHP
jgi:hypothetical protein